MDQAEQEEHLQDKTLAMVFQRRQERNCRGTQSGGAGILLPGEQAHGETEPTGYAEHPDRQHPRADNQQQTGEGEAVLPQRQQDI